MKVSRHVDARLNLRQETSVVGGRERGVRHETWRSCGR
jgi:hypothetical protein